MMNETPTTSMRSTSNTQAYTPSTTTCNSEGQSPSTPSSEHEDQSGPIPVSPSSSSTASERPHLTPSPTPSAIGASAPAPVHGDEHEYDPDTPLPSVECDISSTADRQNISSRDPSTPCRISDADSIRPASDQDDVIQEIGHIENLRLTSPRSAKSPTSPQSSRTPSIKVTPSASSGPMGQTRASRTDSLVTGVKALQLSTPQRSSPDTMRLRESHSPSPSRRQRSGSEAQRERHEVETEDPPEAFRHMAKMVLAFRASIERP
jgi:hypothetical protein